MSRTDCPGCNDGVFHNHGGECEVCGGECNSRQQADISGDVLNPDVVYLCDSCEITERRELAESRADYVGDSEGSVDGDRDE